MQIKFNRLTHSSTYVVKLKVEGTL